MVDVPVSLLFGWVKWLKNTLYEPHAESVKDWWAIKQNKSACKKENDSFAINVRLTEHVIYADGTLILHMKYHIQMLKDGDFKIEKWYRRVNPKTDVGKISKIYKSFYDVPKTKNRFKNYLLVCELQDGVQNKTAKFLSKIMEKNSAEIRYRIVYTNLKKGDKFSFCISLTVPHEFVDHSEDMMSIDYRYGVYRFVSKIDKQHPKAKDFSPTFGYKFGEFPLRYAGNIYYEAFEWTVRNPVHGSQIILKAD